MCFFLLFNKIHSYPEFVKDLEDQAFYSLVEQVFERLKDKEKAKEDTWISADEAMQKLRISSKTTLQKLRDEGKIRFSQPEKKHIVGKNRIRDGHNWRLHWDNLQNKWGNSTLFTLPIIKDSLAKGPWPAEAITLNMKHNGIA